MNVKLSVQNCLFSMFGLVITIGIANGPIYAQTNQPTVDPKGTVATIVSDSKKTPDLAHGNEPKDESSTISSEKVSAPGGSATSEPQVGSSSPNLGMKRPSKQTSDPGWQFAFAPYLYMTGLTGTIGARGQTSDVDLSFGDIFKHLKLGLMGTFEARKHRFVTATDLMWIKLGEERDTPLALYSSAKLGVNLFVFDPEAGYRLYEGKGGSFDVLGGLRVMSVENNLDLRAGILPAVDVSERRTWATPVIGGHGTLNLSPKFYLSTKFDIGGGIGADFTAQFYGGAGYRITPNIALIGGYRYLKTDYDSSSGFVFNTAMNGIVVGAKFNF